MPQASSQSSAEIHRRLFHFDSIIRERQDEMKGKKTCHMNGIYSRVPSRETEKIWGQRADSLQVRFPSIHRQVLPED